MPEFFKQGQPSGSKHNLSPQWYALRTKSRHEKLVRDRLISQGMEPLLPTLKRISQWRDRKKEIEVPLFSCYCFVRVSELEWKQIRMVTGVLDIVGSGDHPEPIPNEEIYAIKKIMTNVLPYDTYPYLREGVQIEVVRGPLQGIKGTLFRKEKMFRLIIGIHLIQQAVIAEVDANDVAPL